VDYRQVELLFDMLVEYFHNKPPPEEQDAQGEWVKVRDGLQGAEHCIRVLTPDEFDEWHSCVNVPIQVDPGRQAVAFCSHEGAWWVVYEDTDEGEVIRRFEKCFEGPPGGEARAPGEAIGPTGVRLSGPELSRFFGIVISLPRDEFPPSHFHADHDSKRAEFSIVPPRLIGGEMSPRAAALVAEWAALHERELLEAWEDHASGQEPRKIEPLK
jgi:hypothetical protein